MGFNAENQRLNFNPTNFITKTGARCNRKTANLQFRLLFMIGCVQVRVIRSIDRIDLPRIIFQSR